MKVAEMNWGQFERWLKTDDLTVLPLGRSEQQANLSLLAGSILAEKVAFDAAEPLGIPVFPVAPYGLTQYFLEYPRSACLRMETYMRPDDRQLAV